MILNSEMNSSNEKFLVLLESVHKQYEKPNFKGHVITATGVNDPDNEKMLAYSKDGSGNPNFASGCSYRIMLDLQFLLNFSLKAKASKRYIHEIENRTLGGMGEQIIDGSADITIPFSYIIPYRSKYITFLHPIIKEPILAIFRQPESRRDIYLGPFSTQLWACIILMWFVIGTTIALFIYLLKKSLVANKIVGNDCSNHDSWLMIFAAVCQQGWHRTYSRFSVRALTFLIFSFGLIQFAAYCAAIISNLSTPDVNIKSYADLISNNYVILTNPITQWGRLLTRNTTTESDMTKRYVDDQNSVKQVLGGGYGFMSTLDYFIPIAQKQKNSDLFLCDTVASVNAGDLSSYSGFYVSKNSSLRKPFNYGIDLLLERGLIKRQYNYLVTETVLQCLNSGYAKERRVTELSIKDLSTAFLILILGGFFSFVTIGFEIIRRFKFDDNKSPIFYL